MSGWVWSALAFIGLVGLVALLGWLRRRGAALRVDGVLHVNVNCSDFERSRAFYERLGFKVFMPVAPEGRGQVAQAVGMPQYTLRGALMRHADGATLNLLEWQSPREEQRPAGALHHLGIARIALTTRDLDGDVATLRAAGVEFLSDAPGAVPDALRGTTRFICFKDPDGTVLELVELGTLMGGAYRASRLLPRF